MKQKTVNFFMLAANVILAAGINISCTENLLENVFKTSEDIIFSLDEDRGVSDFREMSNNSNSGAGTRTVQDGTLKSKNNKDLHFYVTEKKNSEIVKGNTRGSMATSSSIASYGVSASVYPKANTYTSAGCGSYFYNEEIDASTGVSGYYWPSSDYKVSFYAYYPYNNSALTIGSKEATGAPVYSYTVPTTIANQADVMTAQELNHAGGSSSAVEMTFNHHCAALRFVLTNETGADLEVESISIEGVKYSGTLTEGTWTLSSSVNSNTVNPFVLECDKTISDGDTETLTGSSDIFLMLPQTLTSSAKLKLVTSDDTYEADLTGSWAAGNIYTYNIGMTPTTTPDYLRFIAEEAGTFTLTIPANAVASITSISYSVDGGRNWSSRNVTAATTITTPTIEAGDSVLWKGNANKLSYNSVQTNSSMFSSTKAFRAKGNVLSLLGEDFESRTYIPADCFPWLFYGCTLLKEAQINLSNVSSMGNSSLGYMFYNCTGLNKGPEKIGRTSSSVGNYACRSMFYNCKSLTTAPELPATTLNSSCYYYMFEGCTKLTAAPALPAMTIYRSSYQEMFCNCTSLTTAPTLPATSVTMDSYNKMFSGCTSLVTAPELPATNLSSSGCYSAMFYNCISLTTAPSILPSTTNTTGTYSAMFYNCISLTTAPTISRTNFSSTVCSNMFLNCKSLTTVPVINITSAGSNCFQRAFEGCTSLTTAPLNITATTVGSNAFDRTFKNCSKITTAPALPATTVAAGCYRGMFWNCTSLATAPTLPATRVYNNSYNKMFDGCTSLTTAPSLPATIVADSCYKLMFLSCSELTTAPELPATTISSYCYEEMFSGCSKITTAPELPATTVATGCYLYMFKNCSELTTAPTTLPATTIGSYCYQGMFSGCSKITTAPTMSATTLGPSCCAEMFRGCTKLTTAPTLPATTLTANCYQNMFVRCTSLTTAPTLPATTLTKSCYSGMFSGCKNLNYIKMMATDISASNCLSEWVNNVASTGTFVKNSAATWNNTSSRIPGGWTVETASE